MIARLGRLALLLCLGLSACGDLPEPFLGNPGATARRLAQPMTPLLAVPPNSDMLLPKAAEKELATQLASALQATEVPALVRVPEKTDWRLIAKARRDQDTIRPLFSVQDPQGTERGVAEGETIPFDAWTKADPVLIKQLADEAAPRIGADRPVSRSPVPRRTREASITGLPRL